MFLLQFSILEYLVQSGFAPMHDHDSAKSSLAVRSQPAPALYLDCDSSISTMEVVLHFCVAQDWIVAPFGLMLGLGVNQPTFEATAKGIDAGQKMLDALGR